MVHAIVYLDFCQIKRYFIFVYLPVFNYFVCIEDAMMGMLNAIQTYDLLVIIIYLYILFECINIQDNYPAPAFFFF